MAPIWQCQCQHHFLSLQHIMICTGMCAVIKLISKHPKICRILQCELLYFHHWYRNHLITMQNHMPYGITQCYLTLDSGDFLAFTPAKAGARFSDPGEMQGWVDSSCGYIPTVGCKSTHPCIPPWSLNPVGDRWPSLAGKLLRLPAKDGSLSQK